MAYEPKLRTYLARRSLLLFGSIQLSAQSQPAASHAAPYELNDARFHLTNCIQQGTDSHDFLKIIDTKVGRVALFGIPLQQQWSHQSSGDFAQPTTRSPTLLSTTYSFTDAHIAMAYKALPEEEQACFDPMITGFNPADMYAADHIRRVLQTFPGVFSGTGECTIRKEFVSSKISEETASLTNPALDRLLDFAAEADLVVQIHGDGDVPFPKEGAQPVYLAQIRDLFKRHPNVSIIWAHCGVGRIIHPIKGHAAMLEAILSDPAMKNVNFAISWDEVAKYIVCTPEGLRVSAEMINRYPDRFLFGTDEVAPPNQEKYLRVFYQYEPLWKALSPEASAKVRELNYERLFDEGRRKVSCLGSSQRESKQFTVNVHPWGSEVRHLHGRD